MSKTEGIVYKLLLVGESGVGKTSLVKQFVYREFDDMYTKTLGANLYKKEIGLEVSGKTETAKLMIWDLFGDNLFQGIMKSAFNGAEGIIFVCDLTNVDTLWKLDNWITTAFRFGSEAAFIFLANKSDLSDTQFDEEEVEQFAKKYRARHLVTSAKTGENVERAFQSIGEMILNREFARRFVPMDSDIEEEIPILVQVEDKIMDTFCHGVGEYVEGMSIVQSVFEELKIDFEHPTAAQLQVLVQRLLEETEQGMSPREHGELEKTLKGYLRKIK